MIGSDLEDEFIGSVFGEKGQLTVVGWNGTRNKYTKIYTLHCNICSKDEELFDDGYFYSNKSNLIRGIKPCGCSKQTRWTEEQYKIRVKRKCEEYGDLQFLGFNGNYKKANTKLLLRCNKHTIPYVFTKNTINNLFRGQRGCVKCQGRIVSDITRKPDQDMVDSFFASGAFKEGTKFWRSEEKTFPVGKWWNYTCPVCSNDEYTKEGLCSGVFTAKSDNLQHGKSSCRCSTAYRWSQKQREYQINKRIKEEDLSYTFLGWLSYYKNPKSKFNYLCQRHGEQNVSVSNFLSHKGCCPQCSGDNQIEAYINGIYDDNTLVALKFGISNNSDRRGKDQNRKSAFEIRQLKVFTFPTVKDCKQAEKTCKEELQCSILSKSEMPDGHTETTSPLNLEKIIDVYKRHGGKE